MSIGWYCGAGVFGLIGCISLSYSLALLTFFNNNNNLSSVRFLQLAVLSGGCIVEGGRVNIWQYSAYLDCVLVMRVAVSLGLGSSNARSGSREELGSGNKFRN